MQAEKIIAQEENGDRPLAEEMRSPNKSTHHHANIDHHMRARSPKATMRTKVAVSNFTRKKHMMAIQLWETMRPRATMYHLTKENMGHAAQLALENNETK